MTKIHDVLTNQIFGISKRINNSRTFFRITPDFNTEIDYYKISLGKKVIGNTTFFVSESDALIKTPTTSIPTSWYSEESKTHLKPFLFISYIEILQEKGKGWGRKAMQLLYEISQKKSCEGRIALQTSKQNAGFYSHLGFDCPTADKVLFDKKYAESLEFATDKTLNKKGLLQKLHQLGCPRKVNGKYNSAGTRFFIPNEENLSYLFKS